MKINISKAIKQFFPNPSLDMVYFEAIANCLDAGATKIQLKINIHSYDDPKSFRISVEDNGSGFSDRGFQRFCELLETDSADNKGLGRLVFLNYFGQAIYDTLSEDRPRSFILNKEFDKECSKTSSLSTNGTKLVLNNYKLMSIKTYDYLRAETLAKSIQLHFLPRLFLLNQQNIKVDISIEVNTEVENSSKLFTSDKQLVSSSKLPKLILKKFKVDHINLFDQFEILYKIEEDYEDTNLIVALNADNRTIPISDIISKDNIPQGYNCIFLIQSDFFKGKVGNSRQKLEIDKQEFSALKYAIIREIKLILDKEIPNIIERNDAERKILDKKFPHLIGYFDDNIAGLIDRSKILDRAQVRFFRDQKKILETTDLSNGLFKKSLEVSSRVLTAYILHRNLVIKKLQETNSLDSEVEIQQMIVPLRDSSKSKNKYAEIYRNNAWLLDDKFMSYNTTLSDSAFNKLIKGLAIEEELALGATSKPDLSIVFNRNPAEYSAEVVIIEQKNKIVGPNAKEKVVDQIQRRAQKLLAYYPNNIQRMWFYGLVDMDNEFELALQADGYTLIDGGEHTFYKNVDIQHDNNGVTHRCPIGISILSASTFLEVAENRNQRLLNLLKKSFKETS